ncbi:MAG: C39 family peptidase [Candidatus Sericytochromatia bacterium]
MPNLNDRLRRTWEKTTQWVANEKAQQSFLSATDRNQDGQLQAGEVKARFDANQDGFLDSQELEELAIKAGASDLDASTIKAMGQAANTSPQVMLFEEQPEAAPVPETEAPPAQVWRASEALESAQARYATAIPHQPGALPSRELSALTGIRKGLFAIQEQVGNSCGTTSLSMVMKYWQGHTIENSVPTIDHYIRSQGTLELALPGGMRQIDMDGFTAPRDIVSYANSRGLRAGLENGGSLGDLKAYLDKGVPLLCLTDWNFSGGSSEQPSGAAPDGQSLHWVSLIGYEYGPNAETGKNELQLLVGNPHGRVQRVGEADFLKVWSKLNLGVGSKRVDTGMDRLYIAMLPQDDNAAVVGPDGRARPAGSISVSNGSDGLRGWVAKKASDAMQSASEMQQHLAQSSGQLLSEASQGYAQDGVRGMLRNLWNGDSREIEQLRALSKQAAPAHKAEIINELLNKGINRTAIQTLVYDILRETAWGAPFNAVIDQIDMRKLATQLENDAQAGKVLAWIAKSEADRGGQTGPKFEAFATQLAQNHRAQALNTFLASEHTVNGKLVHKVPASVVRDLITRLSTGLTGRAEETAIYGLFKATDWNQFDQVMDRLNMTQMAAELEDETQLGHLTSWTVELALKNGDWSHLSEIVTQLESPLEYGRADNVLGVALTTQALQGKLGGIPLPLRRRLINLLDDITRLRTDQAVQALASLRRV